MAFYRDFVFEYDEMNERFGLRPQWMPGATPATGALCAHDLLEHVSTKVDNAYSDELQALGAMFLVRYESGAVFLPSGAGGLSQSIVLALQETITDMLNRQGAPLPEPTRYRADASLPVDVFKRSVETAFAGCKTEHLEPEQREDYEYLLTLKETMVAHLLRGYSRARRRFLGVDLYTVATTGFALLEEEVNKVLREEGLREGCQVRVSMQMRRRLSVNLRYRENVWSKWKPALAT